jgi:hypothetical protein
MNAQRLLKLADFLDTVDPSNFNYNYWHTGLREPRTAPQEPECGTTACALGWAAHVPEFQEAGLE